MHLCYALSPGGIRMVMRNDYDMQSIHLVCSWTIELLLLDYHYTCSPKLIDFKRKFKQLSKNDVYSKN